MSPTSGISRWLPSWLVLVPLLWGCQSTPAPRVFISPESSLLAVDVRFPFRLSRDPSLVQVFFARGPIHGGMEELPELVPASFVKRDRAYLLDPEPGTYSLVAVTSLVVPPWNDDPVAGGVTQTVSNEEIGHAVIFPAALIQRTQTAVGPGDAAFMGALRVRRSERINAQAMFADDLQQRIAERIRPGVTSESGLSGRFSMTWLVDLEETSFSNGAADRKSFVEDALGDLGDSPWAWVVARSVTGEATAARSTPPAPTPKSATSIPPAAPPEPTPAPPEPPVAVPEPPASPPEPQAAPQVAAAEPAPAPREPAESPARPRSRRFAGVPPESPLAQIERGMHHSEVRRILGDPDDRSDRLTSKAWIPFYTGRGARRIDWIYDGVGRVVFSPHTGTLKVVDVVPAPRGPE